MPSSTSSKDVQGLSRTLSEVISEVRYTLFASTPGPNDEEIGALGDDVVVKLDE